MYRIKDYSYNQANLLGVQIFPSENPKYKIQIYDKSGKFLFYIGDAKNYLNNDYPTFLETHGKEYAEFRRSLYRKRHHKEANKIGSRGYYAYNILW
jgi:hypothetical protein